LPGIGVEGEESSVSAGENLVSFVRCQLPVEAVGVGSDKVLVGLLGIGALCSFPGKQLPFFRFSFCQSLLGEGAEIAIGVLLQIAAVGRSGIRISCFLPGSSVGTAIA
jgi:hypothetical protein